MKRHLTGLLTLAAITLLASHGFAQDPAASPAPPAPPKQGTVFGSEAYTFAQRVADARAVIADPASPPELVAAATYQLNAILLYDVDGSTWHSRGADAVAANVIQTHGQVVPGLTPGQVLALVTQAVSQTVNLSGMDSDATLQFLTATKNSFGAADEGRLASAIDGIVMSRADFPNWSKGYGDYTRAVFSSAGKAGRADTRTTPEDAAARLKQAVLTIAAKGYALASDRAGYLKGALADATVQSLPPGDLNDIRNFYAATSLEGANVLVSTGKLTDALALASDFGSLQNSSQWKNQIYVVADLKARLRAKDALSWAKLAYLVNDFGSTQNGIRSVTTALRSLDRSLTRANAFIACQTDASVPNVLTGVPLPDQFKAGLTVPAFDPILHALITGDKVSALNLAMSDYAVAEDNNALTAAVARIAQSLRDADLNVVRANGFVEAQKKGDDFPVAELQ